jgi:hypothetical protein
MNKKYVFFLLPLLVMPLFAVGYAHFTDQVVKRYKIHVGSVYLNVTGFHVDYATMPDANSNGVIWGDELKVAIGEDSFGIWNVNITANPVTGGFVLNTTTWMFNGGKLPFRLEFSNTIMWDGPYDSDPGFVIPPTKPIGTLPQPPWSWKLTLYKWRYDPIDDVWVRTGPWESTQTEYEPGDYIEVQQHIDFKQPAAGETYQKDWACKWIKLWVTFQALDDWEKISSNWIGTGLP